MLQGRTHFDIDGDDAPLKAEVIRMWSEYIMHTDGGITYVHQGYITDDGVIPAWKIDEHLLIDRLYKQAVQDSQRAKRKKR